MGFREYLTVLANVSAWNPVRVFKQETFVSENVLIAGLALGALLYEHVPSILFVGVYYGQEHVWHREDKLKQDVPAPHSFEGVPHHTSDSVLGRSITLKGHCVYLNLQTSARQMLHGFSFISLQEPYFYFYSEFVTSHSAPMGGEKSQVSPSWRVERLNLNIV